MRFVAAIAGALLGACLCGCPSGTRAYIVTDTATVLGLGGEGVLERAGASAARTRGLSLRIASSSDEKGLIAAMEGALADASCRAVLVLSTIPLDARQYAEGRPDVLVAGYAQAGPAGPGNFLRLSPGRVEAFREAGRRIGGMLAARTEGAAGAPRVGVLAISPTATASREVESFGAGLEEAAPGATPLYREVRNVSDKAAAVRTVREMRAAGVEYFVLKTYGLTVACLEDVAREGGRAVVEDCGASEGCGQEVILSIETDWTRTFQEIFEAMAPGGGSWSAPEIAEAWRVEQSGSGNATR